MPAIPLMRALSATAALALAGCVAGGRNCGPPVGSFAEAPLARLQCSAGAGDKSAQLELGIRYEEGRGVPADLRRAERLYASAARTRQIPNYVYSAPVGTEKTGRMVPIGPPRTIPGLLQARARLARLRAARGGR
jgi:hypothetical protein